MGELIIKGGIVKSFQIEIRGKQLQIQQDSDGVFIIPEQFRGLGTSGLKPAAEEWILVRKPLSEKNIANNVLTHGTGGINIDASRIGLGSDKIKGGCQNKSNTYGQASHGVRSSDELYSKGRFPANFILSHSEDCEPSPYVAPNGDTINQCADDCAIRLLDEQSGTTKEPLRKEIVNKSIWGGSSKSFEGIRGHGDSGGASRFFYTAKSSKRERNEGLQEGSSNSHPTVKAQKLMKYLITMITPPNGIVLDPFMGSGSTGVAAKSLGFKFIGIEKEQEYFDIAQARINAL